MTFRLWQHISCHWDKPALTTEKPSSRLHKKPDVVPVQMYTRLKFIPYVNILSALSRRPLFKCTLLYLSILQQQSCLLCTPNASCFLRIIYPVPFHVRGYELRPDASTMLHQTPFVSPLRANCNAFHSYLSTLNNLLQEIYRIVNCFQIRWDIFH